MGETADTSTKTIRFQEEARDDVFFQALRNRVQAYLLSKGYDGYATPVMWVKATSYLVLFSGLYVLLFQQEVQHWMVWAALGLVGVLLGLNISHDAAHDAFCRSKTCNAMLYYLTFSLLGTNAYLWKLRHVQSHHLFPNVDDCDADIDDNPLIRLSPQKKWYWYHAYQHWYAPVVYLFYSLIWVFIKDFMLLQQKQLANLRQIRHPRVQVWLFYLTKLAYVFAFVAAPVWWGAQPAGEVCVGFLTMHLVSGSAFIYMLAPSHFSEGSVFATMGPDGRLPGSWSRHQIDTSLDYHATRTWANWIFGGFNAHAAHHLFPGICHAHYPAISGMIQEITAQYGMPYRNVAWMKAVRMHFSYLKKMGESPH